MKTTAEAYPLHWPAGFPRTKQTERARFKLSDDRARLMLTHEVRLFGGSYLVISTNIPVRRDGSPRPTAHVADTGVAVYFMRAGKPLCIPCDRWASVTDNITAIAHTIAAMRGLNRWGTGELVERTAQAFTALPAHEADWPSVLGVARHTPWDAIKARYKELVFKMHPDAGGSEADMTRLNVAFTAARTELLGG